MIAQGAMAFNSRCLPSGDPYGVPQIVVTLDSFNQDFEAFVHIMEFYRWQAAPRLI